MQQVQHDLDTLQFWPTEKPELPPNSHGWFSSQNAALLGRLLNKDTKMVIELGSWLGASTRFILDHAPNAIVFAIDTWKGGPDHQVGEWAKMLPTLYETFIVNMWDYRHRLLPLRTTSLMGLDVIFSDGHKPDLIYIDADHTYEAVMKDIDKSLTCFPNATIVGDDWGWGDDRPVQRAVKDTAIKYNLKYHIEGDWAWTYLK